MTITNPVSAIHSRAPVSGSGTMIFAFEDICQKSGATFTASDEVTGFDVENIGRKDLDEVWRADTLASLSVKVDQGDPPTPVRLLTINGSNLTAVRNLAQDSHDPSTANWSDSGILSRAADTSVTDPDGGLSAFKTTESSGGSVHRYSQSYSKPTEELPFYVSVIARDPGLGATSRDVTLLGTGSAPGTNSCKATFDLSAVTVGTATNQGSFTDAAAAVTDLGSGWVLCEVTGTTDASAQLQLFVQLNNAGSETYSGDGTSGIQTYSHVILLGTTIGPTTKPITGTANGALVRARAAQTSADVTSSPAVDNCYLYALEDDLSTHYNHGFYGWLAAPESYRFWQIDLVDENNADAFVDAGRIGLWNAWRPGRNMKSGWTIKYVEADGDNRRKRIVKIDFHYMSKQDMMRDAHEMERARGTKREVIFIADPDETDYPHETFIYGTLTEIRETVSDNSQLWHKGYTIEEILP